MDLEGRSTIDSLLEGRSVADSTCAFSDMDVKSVFEEDMRRFFRSAVYACDALLQWLSRILVV